MKLETLRKQLDDIDERLIRLLARRLAVCEEIGVVKQAHGLPIAQPDRVTAVKRRIASLAKHHGIDSRFAVKVYDLIIREACRREEAVVRDGKETERD